MKRNRLREEQIIGILPRAGGGSLTADVCRKSRGLGRDVRQVEGQVRNRSVTWASIVVKVSDVSGEPEKVWVRQKRLQPAVPFVPPVITRGLPRTAEYPAPKV
jgi:hypothetical protein